MQPLSIRASEHGHLPDAHSFLLPSVQAGRFSPTPFLLKLVQWHLLLSSTCEHQLPLSLSYEGLTPCVLREVRQYVLVEAVEKLLCQCPCLQGFELGEGLVGNRQGCCSLFSACQRADKRYRRRDIPSYPLRWQFVQRLLQSCDREFVLPQMQRTDACPLQPADPVKLFMEQRKLLEQRL